MITWPSHRKLCSAPLFSPLVSASLLVSLFFVLLPANFYCCSLPPTPCAALHMSPFVVSPTRVSTLSALARSSPHFPLCPFFAHLPSLLHPLSSSLTRFLAPFLPILHHFHPFYPLIVFLLASLLALPAFLLVLNSSVRSLPFCRHVCIKLRCAPAPALAPAPFPRHGLGARLRAERAGARAPVWAPCRAGRLRISRIPGIPLRRIGSEAIGGANPGAGLCLPRLGWHVRLGFS